MEKYIYLSKKKIRIERIRNPITICNCKKIAVHVTSYHAQKNHSFSVKPDFCAVAAYSIPITQMAILGPHKSAHNRIKIFMKLNSTFFLWCFREIFWEQFPNQLMIANIKEKKFGIILKKQCDHINRLKSLCHDIGNRRVQWRWQLPNEVTITMSSGRSSTPYVAPLRSLCC